MNMKLVVTVDKCKVTDCDAVFRIISTAEALRHNLEDLIINQSPILREECTIKVREAFQKNLPKFVTVH